MRRFGSPYKLLSIVLLSTSVVIVLSCRKDQTPLVPTDYSDWSSTTEQILNYPIPGHEEHYRLIYINALGVGVHVEQVGGKTYYDYPIGTIIIKDIYASLAPLPDENPVSQTVMIKDPDNTQSRGGWIWVVKDVETGEETVIDYEFCFDCHLNANERHPYGDRNLKIDYRDYVYFPYKPVGSKE